VGVYDLKEVDKNKRGKIYINGVLDREDSSPSSVSNSTTYNLRIGSNNGSDHFFDGVIDDVRIYKSALLSYQIKQLYAQGLIKHLLAFK
jgi:hypothetical protein